jgi:hypothetical protein
MSLCEKFAVVASRAAVRISCLEEKPHRLIGAKRMQTKYGISILLTSQATSEGPVPVFLPKRFTAFFSDVDIEMINNGKISIDFIYHGTSEKTGAFQLSLKPAEE